MRCISFIFHQKMVTLYCKKVKMGIPRFFKVNEPKRFDYKPLYWDPAKEEREDRNRRIRAELGQEVALLLHDHPWILPAIQFQNQPESRT